MRVCIANIYAPLSVAILMAAIGCGGGSGNGGSGGGGGGTHPTAKTIADVADNLQAMGQSVVGISFRGFGPKLQTHNQAFFDGALGLYGAIVVGPAKVAETLYEDQAKTIPAGILNYRLNEITFTLSGPITVDSGLFAGLTGVYNQVLQFDSSNVPNGYIGSINYSMPNIGTTTTQYLIRLGDSGEFSGSATTGVSLKNGYGHTEKIVYDKDGTWTASSTDSASLKGSFEFFEDSSGKGKIIGTDPGLPATVTWSGSGTGQIKFADNSTVQLTHWAIQD